MTSNQCSTSNPQKLMSTFSLRRRLKLFGNKRRQVSSKLMKPWTVKNQRTHHLAHRWKMWLLLLSKVLIPLERSSLSQDKLIQQSLTERSQRSQQEHSRSLMLSSLLKLSEITLSCSTSEEETLTITTQTLKWISNLTQLSSFRSSSSVNSSLPSSLLLWLSWLHPRVSPSIWFHYHWRSCHSSCGMFGDRDKRKETTSW